MIHLTLSPEEQAAVQTLLDRLPPDIPAKRLQLIRLAGSGLEVPEIAARIDMHPDNARKWLHRYERSGIDGLRNKGKSTGRPPLFDAATRDRIAVLYAMNPQAFGLPYTSWSLKKLRDYVIDRGIVKTISIETVRQCIGRGRRG